MRVSIIIPTLDEAVHLPATLACALGQPGPNEVIVADGGSSDATLRIADRAGAETVRAPRGRARQMNAGADVATGDALLFLHADTRLPENALVRVRETLGEAAAGCFRLRFDRAGLWLRLWSHPIWMQSRRFAFGDRALFVRRSAFEAAGGFPDQPIFEDLDLVQALRPHGPFAFLDEAVVTSARRYEAVGGFRQQLRNAALWTAWRLGVAPSRVAQFYPPHRAPRDASPEKTAAEASAEPASAARS